MLVMLSHIFDMNINMLSVLLVFGFIEIISGNKSSMLRSSSSVNVNSVKLKLSFANTFSITASAAASNNASLSEKTQGTNRTTLTRQPSTLPLSTSIHVSSTLNISVTGIVKQIETTPTTNSTFPNKNFSPTHHSNFLSTSFQPTISPTSSNKGFSSTPKATKTPNPLKINVFFWDVKSETLKRMFYGAFGLAIVSIVVLIVVCCCCRRKVKKIKNLQRQLAETLCNPHAVNSPVLGFPSPLRLASFINKPESPYDMPEPVETTQQDEDLSYVTVMDRKESESDYDRVKENGTANYKTDNESRDKPQPSHVYTNEVNPYQSESHNYDRIKGNGTANCDTDNESRGDSPPASPAYTNDGMFETDPYQSLMPSDRLNENPYTSLITRNKSEENEVNEATV